MYGVRELFVYFPNFLNIYRYRMIVPEFTCKCARIHSDNVLLTLLITRININIISHVYKMIDKRIDKNMSK